jgi:hypothetical protein
VAYRTHAPPAHLAAALANASVRAPTGSFDHLDSFFS